MRKSLLIDHLDNTAKLLWQYLIHPKHTNDVLFVLESVYKAYEEPKQSWVTGPLYAWTRTRGDSLQLLISTLKTNGLSAYFVNELLMYLQKEDGGWAVTSSNTQMMFGLIRMIPGYDAEVDDTYLSIDVVKRLVTLVEAHNLKPSNLTQPVVNPLAELMEKKQAEVKAEILAVPKVNIANLAKQLEAFHNDSNRFRKNLAPAVKSLKENAKLAGNVSIVEQMLKKKQGHRVAQPKTPARALSANPGFQQALKTIGLFHQARHAEITTKQPAIQPTHR